MFEREGALYNCGSRLTREDLRQRIPCPVAYEDTEYYRVMRDFLKHHAAMLRELMRQ